jgi:hypothetical protein
LFLRTYLLYHKNICKWHNVPPPSTTIKKYEILRKENILAFCSYFGGKGCLCVGNMERPEFFFHPQWLLKGFHKRSVFEEMKTQRHKGRGSGIAFNWPTPQISDQKEELSLAGRVAPVVECLPSKCETPTSNPSTTKKKLSSNSDSAT